MGIYYNDNTDELDDRAIIRDLAQQDRSCDTCRHEKEPWSNGCADCYDYELWEGKINDPDK